MRKAGITDPATGELVPFPVPRVAELPAGWRRFLTAEKVQLLLGMSLTRAAEILMWPLADLDELQQSLRWQVWRVVFTFCLRAMFNGERDCGRGSRARAEARSRRTRP
jgi:hypothetical protein